MDRRVEILETNGAVLTMVQAHFWKNQAEGGSIEWGGTLSPSSPFQVLVSGNCRLRLDDGSVAEAQVENERLATARVRGPRVQVSFLGKGEPPAVL